MSGHRRRAEVLRERYPFAAEVLALYLALLDAWEGAGEPSADVVDWSVDRVMPQVVKATEAAGPQPLAAAVRELAEAGRAREVVSAWLAGADLPPVERYLARATLRPAARRPDMLRPDLPRPDLPRPDVPRPDAPGRTDPPGVPSPATPRDARAACPHCGGPPQCSIRAAGGEPLVSGRRELACARCWSTWNSSGSACPSCGETAGAKRTVYGEPRGEPVVRGGQVDAGPDPAPTFPHLRIDACASCARYLIEIDLGRDARAVPEVDELVAVPLDLYAAERGLSKITPNLMGF